MTEMISHKNLKFYFITNWQTFNITLGFESEDVRVDSRFSSPTKQNVS